MRDKKKFLFETLSIHVILYGFEVWGCNIYRESWRKIEKMINGGWKAYFAHENNCKSTNLVMWDKNKFLFETLVIPVIMYGCDNMRVQHF